jgi:hypothetical protein
MNNQPHGGLVIDLLFSVLICKRKTEYSRRKEDFKTTFEGTRERATTCFGP